MTHHVARVLAIRANGIGPSLGCRCCNNLRRWQPTFSRTVRAKLRAFDRRDRARSPD